MFYIHFAKENYIFYNDLNIKMLEVIWFSNPYMEHMSKILEGQFFREF